jgi:hypothetical protein
MRAFMRTWLLLALGTCVLAMPTFAAGKERTGPDSFLPYRAYTVEDLVSQVQNDSIVRQRLAKHFHVSQAELVTYLRDNIKVVTFSDSGWKPVYGVTRIGRIYKARDYFHEGGKVFGLADGTPMLKYACGNPLVTQLPPVEKKVVMVPKPAPKVEVPPVTAAPPQYSEVVETPVAPIPEAPVEVQSPEERVLIAQAPAAPRFEVLPTTVSRSLPVWPLLPLFFGGGGPPVIPEPSSVVLLAGGLAALAGILRRRRR